MEKIVEFLKEIGIEVSEDQKAKLAGLKIETEGSAAEISDLKAKLEKAEKALKSAKPVQPDKSKTVDNPQTGKQETTDKPATGEVKKDTDLLKKIEALEEQLADEKYQKAVEGKLSGYNFISQRVKDAVTAEMKSKGVTLENGELKGADEFLKELNKNEPELFRPINKPAGLFMEKAETPDTSKASLRAEVFKGFGIPDNKEEKK